jgi:hypothetical protein
MTAEERRQRIAEAQAKDTGVGVRCPRCLVHAPGLKPRKVKMGTATGPASEAFTSFVDDENVSQSAQSPRRESGSVLRQYQCPVCDYAWSAAPTGATDSR